ncbi:MAG: hypothetical protein QXY49_03825 [Thermofilaceae archaeon]
MPLALKIFEVAEPLSLEEIATKLMGYGILEVEKLGEKEIEVGFRVTSLEPGEGGELKGIFEESFIASITYREEEVKIPVSVFTEFRFLNVERKQFLIVAAKKTRANRIASRLSIAIAAKKRAILEVFIPQEKFRKLYEERPGALKVAVFTNVRLPDVNKLTLYGDQLSNSQTYSEYLKLGEVWYSVFEAEEGLVVGVTRNGIVTFFSKVDPEIAFKFTIEKITPLAE